MKPGESLVEASDSSSDRSEIDNAGRQYDHDSTSPTSTSPVECLPDETPSDLFIDMYKEKNRKASNSIAKNAYKKLNEKEKLKWILKSINIVPGEKASLKNYLRAIRLLSKDEMMIFDEYDGRPKYPLKAYTLFRNELFSSKNKKAANLNKIKEIAGKWKSLPEEQKKSYIEKSKQHRAKYIKDMQIFLQTLPEDRRRFETKGINESSNADVIDDISETNLISGNDEDFNQKRILSNNSHDFYEGNSKKRQRLTSNDKSEKVGTEKTNNIQGIIEKLLSDDSCQQFLGNSPLALYFKEQKILKSNDFDSDVTKNLYDSLSDDEKLHWILKSLQLKRGEKINAAKYLKAKKLLSKEELNILHQYEGRPKLASPYRLFLNEYCENKNDSNDENFQSGSEMWRLMPEEKKSVYIKASAKIRENYRIYFENLLPDRQKLEKMNKRFMTEISFDESYSEADTTIDFDNSILDQTTDDYSQQSSQIQLPDFILRRPSNDVWIFFKNSLYKLDESGARQAYDALTDRELRFLYTVHAIAINLYLKQLEDYLKTLSLSEMKRLVNLYDRL